MIIWQINGFCQSIDEQMKAINYVPNLILQKTSWSDIADSIRLNYPQKEREYRDVMNTVEYLKTDRTDSISMLMNKFFQVDFNQEQLINQFLLIGRRAIPSLIQYLEKDYATRWFYNSFQWDDPLEYFCLSDVALKLIEKISGIHFYTDSSTCRFSDRPIEERKIITDAVQEWFKETDTQSKPQAINYFLNHFTDYNFGNTIETAHNLAVYGDTANAIIHLEKMYNDSKLPCHSNMYIANMVNDLGKDIALENCLHDIYDYRCMSGNGIACVSYIFENAKSFIPFDVLADVVSTERFSRYKGISQGYIWHSIFDYVAITKNQWTKSILMELLRIEEVVKGSPIYSYHWERNYKEQYDANFRVCDFSLLKLNELFPEMMITVDWNKRSSRDKEIKRILENESSVKKY